MDKLDRAKNAQFWCLKTWGPVITETATIGTIKVLHST